VLTLWDFVEPIVAKLRPKPQPAPRRVKPKRPRRATSGELPAPAPAGTMQSRYDQVVINLLKEHTIAVRRWRTRMSGVAWHRRYPDGRVERMLESPYPRGPMSMAIFLHEVGHHVIGFNRYKPRCLEEYHAWAWSLGTMERLGLNVTDSVRYRMHVSLWYAVAKARRRGLKELPAELTPFIERPVRVRRRRAAPSRAKSRSRDAQAHSSADQVR
jgi:hypothetical protein